MLPWSLQVQGLSRISRMQTENYALKTLQCDVLGLLATYPILKCEGDGLYRIISKY